MAELSVCFRLPLPGRPRARFVSDYSLRGGRLWLGEQLLVAAPTRDALERGVTARLPGTECSLTLRASHPSEVAVFVDGEPAPREDRLRAPISRSARIHAGLALAASGCGFIASGLYLRRARFFSDPWAMKMALHMAAWHLLLTVTLFPLSVWAQRLGIRIVQLTSLLFFFIHVGIALANTGASATATEGVWIALLNGASGVAFLLAAIYGLRAYADMDPLRAETP
jgi:hypothetical protein